MQSPASESESGPWFLRSLSPPSINTRSARAWHLLAWDLLESSHILAPALVKNGLRFCQPWMRIWDDPGGSSEMEPFTLTLFRSFPPANQLLVRKAVWRRTIDLGRSPDLNQERLMPDRFDPTITIADAPVPIEEFREVLRPAVTIQLPLILMKRKTESVTSDVGRIGFDFFTVDEQPQTQISLEWSWDIHPKLRPAIEFVGRLQTFLESCLAKSS
jgi:hypothetical protein